MWAESAGKVSTEQRKIRTARTKEERFLSELRAIQSRQLEIHPGRQIVLKPQITLNLSTSS